MPANEHGIFIDAKGFVWLAGNGETDGQILKFTREGKFVMQIGKSGPQTDSKDTTRLGRPANMTVDTAANEVYVADGYYNHRVIVFDSETGAFKRMWGAYGKPPTDERMGGYNPDAPPSQQFANPVHCVRIAKDGLVYVCDRQNNRIQVFRKDGSFVKEMFIEKQTLANGSVWDLEIWNDPRLTHATLDVIGSDPGTRAVAKSMMVEAQTIAEKFGIRFRVDVERRIEGARKVGAHKTSMLQDLERSRPMEIDPLVTVVQEMGTLSKIPTPSIDIVLALVAQRAKVAELY